MTKGYRALLILAVIVAAAAFAATTVGRAHYESPGRDLWRRRRWEIITTL